MRQAAHLAQSRVSFQQLGSLAVLQLACILGRCTAAALGLCHCLVLCCQLCLEGCQLRLSFGEGILQAMPSSDTNCSSGATSSLPTLPLMCMAAYGHMAEHSQTTATMAASGTLPCLEVRMWFKHLLGNGYFRRALKQTRPKDGVPELPSALCP